MATKSLGTLTLDLIAKVGGFEKGMKQAARQSKTSMGQVEKNVVKASKALVALGVAASGVALVKVIADYRAFETGLVGVAKTTGLAGAELESYAAGIIELSQAIPVSTDELLALSQAAGQMGVTGADNLAKFSETVAKLGRASDLAGEAAATSLARILNVTGESITEIDTLASVIVSLGNNVAATESEIAKMTTEVARATSAFGVSSAEAAAMAAAMTSIGIRAELGGSSVGRAMQEITARVRAGGEDLEDFAVALNLNADTLAELFAGNRTAAFEYFLQQVGELGLDAGNALEEVGLGGQEIAKTIIPLSNNMGIFAQTMALANAEVADATALDREFAATAATLDSQIIIFKNSVTALSLAFGNQAGTSGLSAAVAGASEVVQDFTRYINEADFTQLNNFVAQSIMEFRQLGLVIGATAAIIEEGLGFGGYEKTKTILAGLKEDMDNLQLEENGRRVEAYFAKLEKLKGDGDEPGVAAPEPVIPVVGGDDDADAEARRKELERKRELAQAQEALNKLFDSQIDSYRQQIALTGDVTELERIRYDISEGKLVGINEAQQQRLEGLAAEIDAINELAETEERVKAIREGAMTAEQQRMAQLQEQYREIGELVQAGDLSEGEGTTLAAAYLKQWEEAEKGARDALDGMSAYADQAARNMQSAFADFLFDPFEDGLDGLLNSFFQTLRRMAAEAAAAQIFDSIGTMAGGSKNSGGGTDWGSLVAAFAGAFDGGGMIGSGQWGIVGERGPELVQGPAMITSRQETASTLGGNRISVGQMVFPNVRNEREAQEATGAAARQLSRIAGAGQRYS